MSSQRPLPEVNPYAPSATIAEPDPFALMGVGYWRHGPLLVLHEDAHLPPFCVKTGKPALGYRPSPIRWTHVLQWPAEHVRFDVPLSGRPLYWHGPGRPLVLLLAVVALVISVLAVVGIALIERVEGTTEATLVAVTLGGIAICCTFGCWASLAQPLWVVRRKRKYYWLSGAHRKFLAQLPSWPYA